MPRPRPFSGKGKRQRFYARNAVKTTLYRDAQAIDPIKNSSRADQLCRRMMRHAGAPLCLCGYSGPACPRRHPSARRIVRKNRDLPDLPASPGARPSVAGAQCGNPVAEREGLLSLQIPPKKSRLPGALRSCAPAKVLVFMQLFRLPPHYVMRCGPIDLVTMSPWRLRSLQIRKWRYGRP